MAVQEMFSLVGRTALVTGAAQGLGLQIATALLEAGARVVLADIGDRAEAPAARLREAGHPTLAVALDVRREDDFERAFAVGAAALGAIDVLVNNAARTPVTPMHDIAPAEWDDVLAVNLRGTFFGCRVAAAHMRGRGWGRIINMASIAGQQPSAATGMHYAASKGGILALTRAFAEQLATDRVTVNAIAPAAIESPALAAMPPAVRARLQSGIALRRFGEAQEVAAAAVYLASDAAAFTTGATLDVNGGRLMR